MSLSSQYISNLNIVAGVNSATIAPDNVNFDQYQTRPYAGGMFAGAGNYSQVICQAADVAQNMLPPPAANDCGLGVIIE